VQAALELLLESPALVGRSHLAVMGQDFILHPAFRRPWRCLTRASLLP